MITKQKTNLQRSSKIPKSLRFGMTSMLNTTGIIETTTEALLNNK